jgi:FKBP-type peptidyl-prolyl cis-trans isomerase
MIPQRMRTWLIASVVLAVGTSLWAWVPWGSFSGGGGGTSATSADVLLTATGQPVTADKVASLRVARWDEQDKAPQVFEVARKGNAWVIPSHFNYPADAGSKVGETAGAVLNLRRGPLVTNKSEQFAELGVLDPLQSGADSAAAGPAARGRRVTLKDEGGAVLVDLIVGKPATGLAAPPPAPGMPPQPAGELRYVRPAGGDDVYTAKVDLGEISTAFKDWVETDLLKVNRFDVRQLTIRDYTVDEQRGPVVRSQTRFDKAKEGNKWTSPQTPAGHAVNQETIDKLLDETTRLRLTGVRPFDPAWLRQRGFYVVPRGGEGGQVDLYGSEGSLEIGASDGLRYQLFFGSVALGDEEDTLANATATTRPATNPATAPTTAPATQPAKGANRYMAVFVQYDPELDRKYDVTTPLTRPATAPTTQPATTQASAATTQPATQPTRRAPTEAELAEGRKRADEQQAKFLKFFYVISDENFRKMRPPADQLFEDTAVHKDKLPGEKVSENVELKEMPGGLTYADLKEGTGAAEAADGDKVEVHYTGWLAKDGTQFDTSRKGDNTPLSFTIGKGGVIKGWDEGVRGMKVGGKRKLVIPPDLGYGAAGSPPNIPANARLVFDVELLKVEKPAGATTAPATSPATTKASP